ncbi:acyl-CoA dehydrogenase/oxidase C-terminal [Colletotrichum falcatum]|nr:acyl-CoA dehydrogenase/oxidase C-terminal [Colletotrichum falcatum]
MKHSTSDTGFFQEPPVLQNQFFEDSSFQRILRLFLPSDVIHRVEAGLAQFGEHVLSDRIFSWVTDSERNGPYLKGNGRDAFGRPTSDLVVGEGWRGLQDFGIRHGIVATGYDPSLASSARVVQFLKLHLWEGSASNVPCPSAMQDGAARLLQLNLARAGDADADPTRRRVLENALRHLLSTDPATAWTSGQWMTERTGGSDVSLTETVAERVAPAEQPGGGGGGGGGGGMTDAREDMPLGPWSISGFKWFSSATDSAMTILLARTPSGISAFFAPMRRQSDAATTVAGRPGGAAAGTELNGVRIQRLKNKSGTRSLPTAELELDGMRGWLLGREGRGINEIGTVLTITRIHSAVAAVGYLGRGLAVARAYARVRQVGAGRGRRAPLCESPLHMQTLADMTGEYHGLMLLTFFTAHLLGLDENPETAGRSGATPAAAITPDPKHVAPLLRVLTPLCKAYVCKRATPLLHGCMEALGGVGYLLNDETEYLNVARLHRDCCVLSIWEGTTDVLATDFLRALKRPGAGAESIEALDALFATAAAAAAAADGRSPAGSWEAVKKAVVAYEQSEMVGHARGMLWSVAEALVGLLLETDCRRDDSQAVRDMLRRRADRVCSDDETSGGGPKRPWGGSRADSKDQLDRNSMIVYGSLGTSASRVSKL